VKRITLVLGLSCCGVALPATSFASTVTGRHFGVYRYVYRHAVKQFGVKTVGCELMYACHTPVTDEVVVRSTHTLERMLHPRPSFHLVGYVPAPQPAPYSSGWAIPSSIVSCESSFQNLPPNGAGASGYYQIIPSTWLAYGGGHYAPQAYEASRVEQGIIAAKIWAGGAGAGQWVCKA
jgi:hypothetical protein